MWETCFLGNFKWVITIHGISISIFPFFYVLMSFNYKIWIGGNLHRRYCIHIWLLKHTNFSLLRVTWFLTCRLPDPDPLFFFWLKLWWVPPHEMLDSWIIAALDVIISLIQESIVTTSLIWGSFFFFFESLTQQGCLLPVYPPSNSNMENLPLLF